MMEKSLHKINAAVDRFKKPQISIKEDGTPVTGLDIELSHFFEKWISQLYPEYTFYSEENFSEWKFPLCALDPLDGTREYIQGSPEWSISLALIDNEEFRGEGWIYNPNTRESFENVHSLGFVQKRHYVGEVSRSEWNKGLYRNSEMTKFSVSPMGSIAYKLGRLSVGKSDFVVSLKPKNIWDIAAGTILCRDAGLKFYSQGKEVLRVQKLYSPPLIWCHEELFSDLSKIYP